MNTRFLMTIVAASVLLGACAAMPKEDPGLTRARAEVQAAGADPAIVQYSQQELNRANQELDRAQKAARAEDIDQYAYLASRHAALARQQTREALARAQLARGNDERQTIQLAARTAEADRSQRDALIARAQASAATADAAQAQGQAAALTQQTQALQDQAQQLQAQKQLLQDQAQQLQQQLQDLQAKQTDRGLVITLSDVLFDSGKADMKSGAYRQLDKIVAFLKDHPERMISIEGFTDSVGTDDYNQGLSERRAQAVKEALSGRGISSDRVEARGYGKSYPVASNSEAGGRQLNRRVEIVISTGANAILPRIADAR